jgi:threonine dehydrogenase-like Zn-dependent dehydrogenase
MKSKSVIFDKPFNAILKETEQDDALKPNELLVRTERTLVSPGTELAIYRGTESWAPLPYTPGYASAGVVEKVGSAAEGWNVGDKVFSYSKHSAYSKISTDSIMVKVPEGVSLEEAVFTRMAAVSISALRVSPPELGDYVVVQGLGLVGNLAAQLFSLSGASVIGIDICARRLALAKACGIKFQIDPANGDVKEQALKITGGKGAATVVEATGIPSMAVSAFDLAAKGGDIVLLGSPRGKCEGDITGLLNKVHLSGNGCVSLKGAHEWRYPLKASEGCKHSIQRNCEILLSLIADGSLKARPLITQVAPPSDCQSIYQGLLNDKDNYTGVVFDWTKA